MHDGSCISGCLHTQITEELIDEAKDSEKKFASYYKGVESHGTRQWNEHFDTIGYIAQVGATRYFQSMMGIESMVVQPFFVKGQRGDSGDLEWRGDKCDVKGSPLLHGTDIVSRYSRFLISDHQREKVVNKYIFAKVDLVNGVLHIPGMIGYYEFWDLEQEFQSPKMKSPCNFVFAHQLRPVRPWLYAM